MSRSRPFLSLPCREGNKKIVRDKEIDMRVRYERFRVWRVYFMVYQALGHHLNQCLTLCCGLDHGMHQAPSHRINLSLSLYCCLGHGLSICHGLCHGLSICHGLCHGRRIDLSHALGLSMSRSFYV
jgi:hypothetical protein